VDDYGGKDGRVVSMRQDNGTEAVSSATAERTMAEPNTAESNAMDDQQDASRAAARRAAMRCDFQLTYDRALDRREFGPGVLYGPLIPDACHSTELAAGDWESPDGEILTEKGWINRYASYAVQEGVHEALEWFRVDGRLWLDPHGPAENDIYRLVDELVDKLTALRAARHAPDEENSR
jgi:hypothetical protein